MSVYFDGDAYALLGTHLGSMVQFSLSSIVAKADRLAIGLRYVGLNAGVLYTATNLIDIAQGSSSSSASKASS